MYAPTDDLTTVCAYIDGRASVDRSLIGFKEWLVVKADSGNNMHWSGLVSWLTNEAGIQEEKQKIAFLGELLTEFYQFGESTPHDPLLVCYLRYYEWLKSKPWYREIDPVVLQT